MMKVLTAVGIILYLLHSCSAQEYECEYTDGTTLYCESCCEFGCCDDDFEDSSDSRLSGGAISGIVVAVIVVLALKVCCICARVRRYQRCTTTRVITIVPRSAVVTNPNHAGYDQAGIPAIHQPNPRATGHTQQPVPAQPQVNPYHHGYDQQKADIESGPPPPYEHVNRNTQK